ASEAVVATLTTPVNETAPVAPSNVAFGEYYAEDGVAELTWVDNADNETGYRVEMLLNGEWTEMGVVPADATSYYAVDLAPGTTYEYRVSAFNAAGSSEAVVATLTTLSVPAAPYGLALGEYYADDGVAELTWVDNADNEAGYLIEMNVDGAWVELGFAGADATSFYAPDLAPGTSYEFRVSAFNAAGSSEATSATILTPDAEALSLVVTTNLDVVDASDGVTSLREAIASAEIGDTITFAPSLKGETITLSGEQLEIAQGITVDASVLYDAATQTPGITIDANQKSRVFYVNGGTEDNPVELIGLTLTGENRAEDGGGVYALGTTTFTNCAISGNRAEYNGGGVYVGYDGPATCTNCTVSGNTANYGGGVYANDTTTLYNSIVALNYAKSSDADISSALSANSANNLIGFDPKFVVGPVFDADGNLTNADALDLRLSSESWAIDRGDVAYVEGVATDLAGNTRVERSWASTATVDIGAYEYQSTFTKTPETPSLVVTTNSDVVDDMDGLISLREA
ncbi:MAG: fibronectin type III domain-containing protein, partial [Thermoguttaceae bacterium]|nr:fibronectin type III domain-containing protein [Thermoguttaceae bacterium]